MLRRRILLLPLLALIAAACSSDTTATVSPNAGAGAGAETFALQIASSDLYADAPQRVQFGIFSSTEERGVLLLTSGEIDVTLAPFADGAGTPSAGSARYVGAPGTGGDPAAPPALTAPDVARGVYQLEASFDAAGVWQADVSFDVDGSPISLSTQFQVAEAPALPAVGDKALRTDNLVVGSDADPQAIDSRATDGVPVPDPELHASTIAQAIADGEPALVLFATPVYCQSQFCGPTVDALEDIATSRPKAAVYIHVEIWEDFAKSTVNQAAADWLLRDGNLTEPWLYLIGPDGRIVDRWGPLFDPAEVELALDGLPAA